jgi:hypothetical protein
MNVGCVGALKTFLSTTKERRGIVTIAESVIQKDVGDIGKHQMVERKYIMLFIKVLLSIVRNRTHDGR